MDRRGVAMAVALGVMVVVLMLSFSIALFGERSLRSGRDARESVQARAYAESGLEHARLWAKAKASEIVRGSYAPGQSLAVLSGEGYEVRLSYGGEEGSAKLLFAESVGVSGAGRHVSRATVRVAYEERSAFKEGWFTGGRVSITGQLQLYGARLHGDGGYTINDQDPNLCLPDGSGRVVCKPIQDYPEAVRKALVTGGIDAYTCDAPGGTGLCVNSRPASLVCPVWGLPRQGDDRPCWDSLAGTWATVSTATRVPPPDLQEAWQRELGLNLTDNPYDSGGCQYTVFSVSALLALLPTLSGSPKVCFQGDLTLDSSLTLSGVRLYVSGDVNQNSGSLTLRNAALVSGKNMNLKGVTAKGSLLLAGDQLKFNRGSGLSFTGSKLYGRSGVNVNQNPSLVNSKLFSGGAVHLNGNDAVYLEGDSAFYVNGNLIFNGRLKSSLGASPLLVASGDVTFNGSYTDAQSASFIWARGAVRFNGNTTYRGGIVSGGGVDVSPGEDGIVVKGGLDLYKTVLDNSAIPKYLVGQAEVVARR